VVRKSSEAQSKRLVALSREHEKTQHEVTELRLLVQQSTAKQGEAIERKEQATKTAEQATAAREASEGETERLKRELAQLQYERRKDAVLLRTAPKMMAWHERGRSHAGGRAAKKQAATASDLLRNLEKELGSIPERFGGPSANRSSILLGKALREVDSMQARLLQGTDREEELMSLLVDHLHPEKVSSKNSTTSSSTSAFSQR
jgi:hypothetical protein